MDNIPDKKTSFLVVDDIEMIRKLITKNLNAMGYRNVSQAANGLKALHELESDPTITVVITDWNMPVMSGLELLRAIRNHEKFKSLPVLMVTAEIARHQVQEAAEAGVSEFLVKPFTMGNLQAKLDKILAASKRGEESDIKLQQPNEARQVAGTNQNATALSATMPTVPEQPVFSNSTHTGHQPVHGGEPAALIITDDLQARMTKQADILVVDDVADNIDVLVGLLQDEYKVRAAKSGESALKMLAGGSKLPDLILLDVMMPEMDGFEVCRRLKTNPRTAGIPVIFLTAVDDATNVVQGFELGAVDYVTKPANPTVLKVRVRNHLTRSKAFSELKKQNQVLAENLQLREEVDRMTAHDLKNPIGGIINFTGMLLSDEMMTNDQKELLQSIDDSAHSLLNMVTLSLDLFKMEQGTFEMQPSRIDLIEIIRKVLAEKNAELEDKQLSVTNTLPRTISENDGTPEFQVQGDGLLCYSMFGNLIKNAVEASPVGGKLDISFTHDDNGLGKVTITNSGAVPKDIRGTFFDKYVTAGKKGGTGLGTYSAKLLASVQQGTIDMQADDEKNETTLTITLPLVV